MQWIIEAYSLTKNFPLAWRWRDLGEKRKLGPKVVDQVDLLIGKGELFGLVGPNGAGKTTLIKMLTSLVVPSSWSIRIAGYDIREEAKVKKAIGLATSDERSFYWRLTGRQNLHFFAGLHNLSARKTKERVNEVLSQVGLEQMADRRFHIYSTGMRQRLAIARALLTEPQAIFMDEPTKGLDPLATSQLHKLIRKHVIEDLGITVFLTSHDLAEVERLCDRIAIMNAGKIQVCGPMKELRKIIGQAERYRVEVQDLREKAAAYIVNSDNQIQLSIVAENRCCFEFDSCESDDRLSSLICNVQAEKGKIKMVTCNPVTLDVIFEELIRQPEHKGTAGTPATDNPITSVVDREESSKLNKQSQDSLGSFPGRSYPPLSKWVQSKARVIVSQVKKDMLSEMSYRLSFFMQFTEIFLTVAALYFLSRLIGQEGMNRYLVPYGGNYFAFAIIGVAFYSYFNIGFSIYGSQLREAQTTGTLEAMLVTPTGLSSIVLSSSIWAFLMATMRVVIILISGAFLLKAGMKMSNFPLVLLILILTVASASSFGIVAASFIMVFKKGDPVSWLFKSASYLLGGVVFPVEVLPPWMQKMALLLPTTHSLKAMRLVLLQGKSMKDILPEIGALCVFCFIILPISLRGLRYAVRRAKQEGTLTHY